MNTNRATRPRFRRNYKVARDVKAAGMDPEQAPKVKELTKRLAWEAVDITALENEVYDHLYSFFSRYYDEGDFIL